MKTPKGKVRLAIDFRTAQDLIDFVDNLREADPRYEAADAYAMDGIDMLSEAGVTKGNTFVLKSPTDRVPGTALRDSTRKVTVEVGL